MISMRAMILRMMNRMLANYEQSGWLTKRMISVFMHHFPGQITCEEFGDFMGAYLDNELPEDMRRRFEFHLEACPMCRAHLADYRTAIELARASEDDIQVEVPQELINAILAARPKDDPEA
jgi:anti-sigma factor RsiW